MKSGVGREPSKVAKIIVRSTGLFAVSVHPGPMQPPPTTSLLYWGWMWEGVVLLSAPVASQ